MINCSFAVSFKYFLYFPHIGTKMTHLRNAQNTISCFLSQLQNFLRQFQHIFYINLINSTVYPLHYLEHYSLCRFSLINIYSGTFMTFKGSVGYINVAVKYTLQVTLNRNF